MTGAKNALYPLTAERLSFLSRIPLFASLADEELMKIARGLEPIQVSRGEVICNEGEPGDSFYIIRSGAVGISTKENGQEKILSQLYRGDFFGETSLLTGEPRSATVKALLDVDLFVLSKNIFEQIIHDYPLVSIHLNRILSHRLKKTISSIPQVLSPFLHSVIGSEKGVGSSTFVREIATSLALDLKKRVLVVDLEGEGTCADLELFPCPVPDPQLLEDFDLADKELLLRCWFRHSSGFTLFSFSSKKDRNLLPLINSHLSPLLGILRKNFDYVFLDLPPFLNRISKRALRLSDKVLYLIANTSEGIKEAKDRLIQIKGIVGTSPSAIQVGVSHLIGTTGLYRSHIAELLDLAEVPEVWVIRGDREVMETKPSVTRKRGGARTVAREIGGVRIGLALGAGGARGWAHVGVLRALEDEGVPVDMIAGTSIGALVGATYAKTVSSKRTYQLTVGQFPDRRVTRKRIYDYTLPRRGFIKGNKIVQMLQEGLECADFLDLKIPFAAVAVDISTGQEVVLDSGSVADAVRASIAIPGVIEPFNLKGRWLVDGTLVNPVPASILIRKGINFIIAVFLENKRSTLEWDPGKGPHIINILTKSFDIIRSQVSQGIPELVNVAIYPPVDDFRWDDFHRGDELVKLGCEATYEVMERIRKLLP